MRIVGTGTRVLNFLVDTAIAFAIGFTAFKIRQWYVVYYKFQFISFAWFFFTAVFMYYFLLETLWGRTVGKWLTYSKVLTKEGKRANALQILIRSLMRITVIDMFCIPFLGKPLHDYVSKTEVVEA
jgi:uncharacterized RDD family membrane protein YckC